MKCLRYGAVTIPNKIYQLKIKYISRVIHWYYYSNHLIFWCILPFGVTHVSSFERRWWYQIKSHMNQYLYMNITVNHKATISNQVAHKPIFIYETWPLIMTIDHKLNLAPPWKENHITFYTTKLSTY